MNLKTVLINVTDNFDNKMKNSFRIMEAIKKSNEFLKSIHITQE